MGTPLTLGLIGLDYAGEPLESPFAAASRRGLQAVELYLEVNAVESDAGRIAELAGRHNVRIASISSMAKLNQAEAELPEHLALVRRSMVLAAELGVGHVTCMYGGNASLDRRVARERFLGRVAPLVEEAAGRGLTLLLENVFSRVPPGDLDTADVTAELLDLLGPGNVGLSFDLANYAIGGEEAYPYAYRRLRPYIRYIHLKDTVRYRSDWHGPLGARRPLQDHARGAHISVPLGTGAVNYDAFLAELAADRYSGVVALEPFAHGAEREAWLDETLTYLAARDLYERGRDA